MTVEFSTTAAKVYVERRVDVSADIDGDIGPVRRTKTIYFTPTRIRVELLETTGQPRKVKKVVLVDANGDQAFYGEDWETTAPAWTHNYVRYLLGVDWGDTNPVLPLTAEEIEAQHRKEALKADHHHVNPKWVLCVYDRCPEILRKVGKEHPWVTARRRGWKLLRPEARPFDDSLVCPLEHDKLGNPFYKD